MLKLIAWRLVQLPLILAAVFIITFTLAWILPGDPLSAMDAKQPPIEVQEALKQQYNLDSPWSFLGGYLKGVFVGSEVQPAPDFGPSLRYPTHRVSTIIADALPVSVSIGALAIVIGLFIGTTAGVIGALRPGSMLDGASLGVALLGISLPSFVTGSLLLVIFGGLLGWLPIGGWVEHWPSYSFWKPGWGQYASSGQLVSDTTALLTRLILPALTLGLAPAAYIARLVRLGLADIMSSDFVRTARAKGLSDRAALFKHAMKVALLPVLSFMGPAAASAMTGSFVVEKVFGLPGLGNHFVTAVLDKDQFLILGLVLTFATLLVLFNLAVDIAYAWLDPRIRLA